MGIDLGPFQHLRSINFKTLQEAINVGTITEADVFFPYTLQCTCEAYLAALCNDNKSWPGFRTDWEADFSSPTLAAAQCDYVIVGQTSGASSYMGGKDWVINVQPPFSCFWYHSPDNTYIWQGGLTTYLSGPEKNHVAGQIIDPVARGYTKGEAIDVYFTAPASVQIQDIDERNAGSVWVNSAGHGSHSGDWMEISGTEDYNGEWKSIGGNSARWGIATPYIGDNVGGSFKRIFDHA